MLAPMVLLLLGLDWTLGGQILSYNEPQHSRSETGVPGTNVTGKWSWVDSRGQQHHIWYVADTGGFRAFGDLIPGDPQKPSSSLKIGTPVISGDTRALPSNAESLRKSLPVTSLEKKPLSVGTPALRGPHRISNIGGSNHFRLPSIDNQPKISRVHDTVRSTIKSSIGSPVSTPASIVDSATPFALPQFMKASRPEFKTSAHAPTVHLPSRSGNIQGTFTNTANGQVKDALTQRQPNKQDGSTANGVASKSMTSKSVENVVSLRVLGKAIAAFSLPNESQQDVHHSSNKQQEIQDMMLPLEVLLPAPAAGSEFVLINRLRHPTAPKKRVGSPEIVPQPVGVRSPFTQVIMGLHTSGRPPIGHRMPQSSTNLAPLGIHLLNLVPFRSKSKSISANSPVPRPMRVIGAPNLDNFFRPATLARTTPSPFRRPNPTLDYDYQYYDYDYYDYANYDTSSSSGGPQNTEDDNTSIDGSDENDNSTEHESPDSDENDD